MKIHELVDKLLADIVNVLQLTRRLESSNIFSGCQLKGFRRKATRAHDYIYFSSIHANNEIRIESICYLASGELNSRHPEFSRTNIRYFPPPVSFFYVRGRAMPHAVLRRPLTAETRVQFQASPCGICGGQSSSFLHCQYHSTSPPYTVINL